ncbi:hypothetical protein Bpfe_016737 [Biomphalaria pfeifferi]|uniref:Uncharacterized protein n=1 Tax=Biomphalaria pfeifferi TaxID=112525 RepID=A0AAD8BFQ1_BIOPF|nr:hypothetical protein Bpfe_016737 [Biomphalaria pfeifferi]
MSQQMDLDRVEDSLTSFLLKTVFIERKNESAQYEDLSQVLKNIFMKSGIPLQGIDALRVNAELFTSIFVMPQDDSHNSISSAEYFSLILDEKLGWLTFLYDLLASVRVPVANRFLEKLLTYVTDKSVEECQVSNVKLLVLGLTLVHTLLLDLVSPQQARHQDELSEKFEKKSKDFQLQVTHLSQLNIQSMHLLKKHLNSDLILSLVVAEDQLFSQLVHLLSMSVVIFNPCSLETDVTKMLCCMCKGKVTIPEKAVSLDKNNRKTRKKVGKVIFNKPVEMISIDLNKYLSLVKMKKVEDVSTGCKPGEENLDIHKDGENSLINNAKNVAFKKEDLTCDSKMSFEMDKVGIKCDELPNSEKVYNIALSHLKHEMTTSLYCDLLSFYCSVDKCHTPCLYRLLRRFLTNESEIRIGAYVLNGKQLTRYVLNLIMNFLDAETNSSSEFPQDLISKLQSLSITSSCVNVNRLLKSEVELIVESGRLLSGQADLMMLKAVVSSKEPGWKDLLALGLNNDDIINWWSKGYYDLVCEHQTVLMTEDNVQRLFHVTCHALRHHKDIEMSSLLNQIFKRMFLGLSTPLQEHIVLSVINTMDTSESVHKFQHQLSQEVVLNELIPLYNKLTLANIDLAMSTVLYLCLFYPDVVIKQSLLMAIGNKSQVGLFVHVFQKFSNVCKSCRAKAHQSRLIESCQDVLRTCELDEKITKNTAHLLTELTKSYTLTIDVNSGISFQQGGLLSPFDVVQFFVVPGLISNNSKYLWSQSQGSADISPSSLLEPSVLFTNLSLNILLSLLENMKKTSVVDLYPFPLLAVLSNLYLDNYFVYVDGQLDKNRVTMKQYSQLCLLKLMKVMAKCSKLFLESSFYWLRNYSLTSGWLHVALLKPVLDHCCDLEFQSLLGSVMRTTSAANSDNLKLLMLITQLALVNDEMFLEIQHFLQHVKLSASSGIFIIVIQQMLLIGLPADLQRLVKLLTLLVESQVLTGFIAKEAEPLTMSNKSILVGQYLTDAVILLCSELSCQSSLCHVTNNYISAIQVLVPAGIQDVTLLMSLFCQHCHILSIVTCQVAQVLQMSALDLLMKLKPQAASKHGGKQSVLARSHITQLEDQVVFVKEEGVRSVLVKQTLELVKKI